MVYSMTGYGKAEQTIDGKQIIVELKSLNGKQFEIVNRINPLLKKFEADIRSILIQKLIRGSIDVSILVKQDGASKPVVVNNDLLRYYYKNIEQLASELQVDISKDPIQILTTIMKMPEVVSADTEGVTEAEWEVIASLLNDASDALMNHRKEEGEGLTADLHLRITNIQTLLAEIAPYEQPRIDRIKSRINQTLEESVGKEAIDLNRLEQELVFYIEKNDISEEKQRLASHCTYFLELLSNGQNNAGIGKKIGFIMQEIGREINTLGSKANDALIQKIVVNMKDELEKAKEQSLNVL